MSDPRTVEAFSVSHAAILDGVTPAEQVNAGLDIYGVRDSTLAVTTSTYDNTGDDVILSSWFWFDFATLTIKSGFVPFSLIASMSGAASSSSGVAPNDYYNLQVWNKASLNVAPRPVLVRCPSKDVDERLRSLDFVLYKVQFQPIAFEGPTYKAGLIVDYIGKALISPTDEVGATLPVSPVTGVTDPAIARLVSRPYTA